MKTGLYFGSFNPIHTGHLIIANYFATQTDLNQVWFVVSPQSPFKEKNSLLDEKHRLYMVNLAVEDNYQLRASSIEFHLPRPSYTIDTLAYLKEKYPDHEFVLIMGSDNLMSFEKWKNYDQILRGHSIYVYVRNANEIPGHKYTGDIRFFDVPLLDISSTYIRDCIRKGRSVRYMVPDKIWKHLEEMGFYKT